MYIHCRHGFAEIDRWDGTPIPLEDHMRAIEKVRVRGRVPRYVMVVRARDRETIEGLLVFAGVKAPVFKSPKEWDYEWRAYVGPSQLKKILSAVVDATDYRNFKHHCQDVDPQQYPLALAIWNAAYAKAPRQIEPPKTDACPESPTGRHEFSEDEEYAQKHHLKQGPVCCDHCGQDKA